MSRGAVTTRLLHLNGPPGIGKSTLARMYVEHHGGVLNCDIDVLRTLVGGWSSDFVRAGELIRPVALAMIGAHLSGGHDVVLPQMLVDATEIALFETCAHEAGADFAEVFLMDDCASAVERFHRRGTSEPDDPLHSEVQAIVSAQGGDAALAQWHAELVQLIALRPHARVVVSIDGDVGGTYDLVFP